MVERDDDDHLRTFEAFAALRRRVVKVSADFGQRLAVRLLALAAARDRGDPGLIDVALGTAAEGLSLILSPLERREPTQPSGEDEPDDERD